MVPTPHPLVPFERYNMTNTMSASNAGRLLIAIVAAGLALSSRGASATALTGQPTPGATAALASTPAAVEDAAVQAEASRLTAAFQADPQAMRSSADRALASAPHDATIAA